MAKVFADTYALVSAMDGSAPYIKMLRENDIVTTHLNLVELGRAVALRHGTVAVASALRPLAPHCVEPGNGAAIAATAAVFRFERNAAGGNLSTVDAWGYAMARDLDVPFLTGDEDFRGVPGVKFVKA